MTSPTDAGDIFSGATMTLALVALGEQFGKGLREVVRIK